MHKLSHEQSQRDSGETPAQSSGVTRRDLLKTPLVLTAGSIAMPALLGSWAGEAKADGPACALHLAPRYYPVRRFRPEIDLQGTLAVITGASRGIGRAVGEALAALGVTVLGTSRHPAGVPNPPAFPLLPLDIAKPASVSAFLGVLQSHPTWQQRGRVDILVNNASRFVLGHIIPVPPTDVAFYLRQRALGLRTLYSGHVMLTNVLLPLMAQQGYARIIFTVSIASYFTGATLAGGSGVDVYNSGKAALRGYAYNLGAALREGGSSLRVSTVHPYFVNTTLVEHPNPIYTQPVNSRGLSDTDPAFNSVITSVRQLTANGLPPSMVGETYAQLLRMADPAQHVVVASPREPLATQGANALIEPQLIADNQLAAVPFACSPA